MIRYASHEELEESVRDEFAEEIEKLQNKVESLEENIQDLEAENSHLNDRETDLEKQRDELQDTLYDARKFIEWVVGAYPDIEVEYHAIMQIKGEGYGIPKHSSI
jgi:chromosome segregation ATPase